jgi:pyridoxine/pyridoxamine 5'-phosphate oxidase
MPLQKSTLVEFVRARVLGVASTISASGAPEAAVVNLAVTDDLELIFYAVQQTRKCANLRRDPRIAVVVGWEDEQTLQLEGIADEPVEFELERLKQVYAASRPSAAAQMVWPGLTYFRVRPTWARLSKYSRPWSVEEATFELPKAAKFRL